MLNINDKLYNHALNQIQNAFLWFSLVVLFIAYFRFYLPSMPKANSDQKVKESPVNFKKIFMLGITAITACIVSFYYLHNIYLAILIAVSIAMFIHDTIKDSSFKNIVASFNACFINLLLVVGFAFNGINKIYRIINNKHNKIISSSLAKMKALPGMLLLFIGLGGIYASRGRTAESIRKLKYNDLKSINTVFALAVAIQGACQTYTPVKDLFISWALPENIAVISTLAVSALTLLAIFALLTDRAQPAKNQDNTQKTPKMNIWDLLSISAAALTGFSTYPFNHKTKPTTVIFWILIALFSFYSWHQRLKPAPKISSLGSRHKQPPASDQDTSRKKLLKSAMKQHDPTSKRTEKTVRFADSGSI